MAIFNQETARNVTGTRIVITTNQNTAGVYESRVYIKSGMDLIASPYKHATHKTLAGAQRWAAKAVV